MKTLDEVIKAMSICKNADINRSCKDCPMPDTQECMGVLMTDALHYLKEFKRISARLEKIAFGNITETLEKLDNPALTWDELKQMERKPVWVETDDNGKFWTIVDNFRTICNQECLCCSKGYMCRSTHARGDWRAYRKER